MTELFDSPEEDIIEEDPFISSEDDLEIDTVESKDLGARRRLENLLEEKRLRKELGEDDFVDF